MPQDRVRGHPTGAYNIMMMMVAENAGTLHATLEVCSIRTRKGIRRSEATIGEAPIIPKYLPIKIVPDRKVEIAPCGIHCGRCLCYENQKCLAVLQPSIIAAPFELAATPVSLDYSLRSMRVYARTPGQRFPAHVEPLQFHTTAGMY